MTDRTETNLTPMPLWRLEQLRAQHLGEIARLDAEIGYKLTDQLRASVAEEIAQAIEGDSFGSSVETIKVRHAAAIARAKGQPR